MIKMKDKSTRYKLRMGSLADKYACLAFNNSMKPFFILRPKLRKKAQIAKEGQKRCCLQAESDENHVEEMLKGIILGQFYDELSSLPVRGVREIMSYADSASERFASRKMTKQEYSNWDSFSREWDNTGDISVFGKYFGGRR